MEQILWVMRLHCKFADIRLHMFKFRCKIKEMDVAR